MNTPTHFLFIFFTVASSITFGNSNGPGWGINSVSSKISTKAENSSRALESTSRASSHLESILMINCNTTSFDIFLVLDSSASIGGSGFDRTVAWASDFSRLFGDESFEGTRLGIIQFALRAFLIQDLTNNNVNFTNSVNRMEFLCGISNRNRCIHDRPCVGTTNSFGCQTAIGDGLELAYERLVGTSGGTRTTDQFVRSVIVLLTDGFWNVGVDPRSVVPEIHRNNITVIAIGVGRGVNIDFLRSLATEGPVNNTDANVIITNSFSELNNTLTQLRETICSVILVPQEPSPQPPPPPIPVPAPIVPPTNIYVYSPLLLIPILLGFIAYKAWHKNPEPVPQPDPQNIPIIVVQPPPEALRFDAEIGASGAPPAGPNRPKFTPASRITPTIFNGNTGNNRTFITASGSSQ